MMSLPEDETIWPRIFFSQMFLINLRWLSCLEYDSKGSTRLHFIHEIWTQMELKLNTFWIRADSSSSASYQSFTINGRFFLYICRSTVTFFVWHPVLSNEYFTFDGWTKNDERSASILSLCNCNDLSALVLIDVNTILNVQIISSPLKKLNRKCNASYLPN